MCIYSWSHGSRFSAAVTGSRAFSIHNACRGGCYGYRVLGNNTVVEELVVPGTMPGSGHLRGSRLSKTSRNQSLAKRRERIRISVHVAVLQDLFADQGQSLFKGRELMRVQQRPIVG